MPDNFQGQPIQNAPDLQGLVGALVNLSQQGKGAAQVPTQAPQHVPQMPISMPKQELPQTQQPQQNIDALKSQAYQDYMKYLYMRGARRAAMKGAPLPLSETQEQQFPEQTAVKAGLSPKPIKPGWLSQMTNFQMAMANNDTKKVAQLSPIMDKMKAKDPEAFANTWAMATAETTKLSFPAQRLMAQKDIAALKSKTILDAIDKTTSAKNLLMQSLDANKMSREEYKQGQINARHAGDLEIKGKAVAIRMQQLQLQAEEAIADPTNKMAMFKAKMSAEALKADRSKIYQQIQILSTLQRNPSLKPKQLKELAAKLSALYEAANVVDNSITEAEAKLSPYTSPEMDAVVKQIRQGVPKANSTAPTPPPSSPSGPPADRSQVGEKVVGGQPINAKPGAPTYTMDQARKAVKKAKPNWTPAQIDAAVYVSRDKGNILLKE